MLIMKRINHILTLSFVLIWVSSFSQSITLNACHALIENQDYIFNQIFLDATGRNTFETDPVDDNSPCVGIGNCEFQIAWNETNLRWEIYADDGNGTFVNTHVLYYNTTASLTNPLSLSLGDWVEETAVTESLCGAINSLTGDVQDTTLGVDSFSTGSLIRIYPNPAKTMVTIGGFDSLEFQKIDFYDISGRLIWSNVEVKSEIDVTKLSQGVYFIQLTTKNRVLLKKVVVQ